MNRQPEYYLLFITTFLFIAAAGCNTIELERITVSPEKNRLIIEAGFTGKIPYSVRSERVGRSIILRTSGTVLSEKLATHQKVTGNNPLSGWVTRTVDGELEVDFLLNGPYEFSHSELLQKHPIPSASPYSVIIVVNRDIAGTSALSTETTGSPVSRRPLAKGIALYHEGQYDDALNEFNLEVRQNRYCPLAYYYAARIRLQKKQYARARKNLLAAIRDSSDFADATAVLAVALREMGNTEEALTEWRRFVTASGPADGEKPTAASIMLPEYYREKRDRIISEQRKEHEEIRKRLENEQKEKEILAQTARRDSVEKALTDSLTTARMPETAQPVPDTSTRSAIFREINSRLRNLDQRIRTYTRQGIYSIAALIALIAAGFGGFLYLRHKRRTKWAERSFSREVKKFLNKQDEQMEKFDHNEVSTIHDYQIKRQRLDEEKISALEPHASRKVIEYEPPESPSVGKLKYGNITASHENAHENTPGKHTITEEIKTLVTRMYHENRTIEDICRASDLTVTEVKLIVAVRAKRMEELIEDISGQEEDIIDKDHLYQTITGMHSEGVTPIEIAKKLDVSTGAIELALAVRKVKEKQT